MQPLFSALSASGLFGGLLSLIFDSYPVGCGAGNSNLTVSNSYKITATDTLVVPVAVYFVFMYVFRLSLWCYAPLVNPLGNQSIHHDI